jgi:hypothetical protein
VVPNGENLNKTSTVIEVIPPSRVRLPEFFVAKVFELDITDITLQAGRYWIGLDPVDYTVQDITWYIVFNTPNPEAVSKYTHNIYEGPWVTTTEVGVDFPFGW